MGNTSKTATDNAANKCFESTLASIMEIGNPAYLRPDGHEDKAAHFTALLDCYNTEGGRHKSTQRISKMADVMAANEAVRSDLNGFEDYVAFRDLAMANLLLLRDWFSSDDCSLQGFATLVALAELDDEALYFKSALDLMFMQISDGAKCVKDEEKRLQFLDSSFRRNYDYVRPAKPNGESGFKGLKPDEDPALDVYTRFKKAPFDSQGNAIEALKKVTYGMAAVAGIEGEDCNGDNYATWGENMGIEGIDDLIERARPRRIVEEMTKNVIGQDEWCMELSKYVNQRLHWIKRSKAGVDNLPPSRFLLAIAETASGKTYSVREYCKCLGVPTISINSTFLTGTGWKGHDLNDDLMPAIKLQKESKSGVVVILVDEIDKTRIDVTENCRSFNSQKDFLTLADGGMMSLGKGGSSKTTLDLDRCVFVFMGAFSGIEDIVRKRLKRSAGGAGFVSSDRIGDLSVAELRAQVTQEDLVEWGFMPEFCGRLGTIRSIPSLSEQTLVQIANLQVNQLSTLLDNAKFTLDSKAALQIARRAQESGMGARSIGSSLGPLHADALAECDEDSSIREVKVELDEGEGLALRFERA